MIAREGIVLHPGPDEDHRSGGDEDCAVSGIDPAWPLRLDGSWRLLQAIEYDLGGTAWVLQRGAGVAIVDTVDDPSGDGRTGFRTSLAVGERAVQPRAARAVYLTLKRIFKADVAAETWACIARDSAADPASYRGAVERALGPGRSAPVLFAVARGVAPDARDVRRARRHMALRRRARLPHAPSPCPRPGRLQVAPTAGDVFGYVAPQPRIAEVSAGATR